MPPLTDEDIAFRTRRHPPRDEQVVNAHVAVRGIVARALEGVRDNTPPCREQSLAFTHLETAMFWANAAIARTQKTGPSGA